MSGFLLQKQHNKPVDIAVIRLPRISNFTDLSALEQHSYLGVRFVSEVKELGTPDVIVLPGTKSTMADLQWMRDNGLADAIASYAQGGGMVLGICGGFQMLGKSISDPEGSEGAAGSTMEGLGLLPMETVFSAEKTKTQVTCELQQGIFAGCQVEGYEIHMGISTDVTGEAVRECAYGNVYGTYLHGLFDDGHATERLAEVLAQMKGLEKPRSHMEHRMDYKNRQYDALADAVRANMDMDYIYQLIGIQR